MISQHFDKNNLHHAYLIEGAKDEILSDLFSFIEELDVKTNANPDFCYLTIDNFKKDEAISLREMGSQKSFSVGKKVFVLCINRFNLDSQNILLKMFEEPIENTHFFIITPNVDGLLKTFISRFYLISLKSNSAEEIKNANLFLKMSLKDRLDFIKDNIVKTEKKSKDEDEDAEGSELVEERSDGDSNQSRALRFLDTLEQVLLSRLNLDSKVDFFEQIFKVREYLRQPGSSAKMLLESLAIAIPKL